MSRLPISKPDKRPSVDVPLELFHRAEVLAAERATCLDDLVSARKRGKVVPLNFSLKGAEQFGFLHAISAPSRLRSVKQYWLPKDEVRVPQGVPVVRVEQGLGRVRCSYS